MQILGLKEITTIYASLCAGGVVSEYPKAEVLHALQSLPDVEQTVNEDLSKIINEKIKNSKDSESIYRKLEDRQSIFPQGLPYAVLGSAGTWFSVGDSLQVNDVDVDIDFRYFRKFIKHLTYLKQEKSPLNGSFDWNIQTVDGKNIDVLGNNPDMIGRQLNNLIKRSQEGTLIDGATGLDPGALSIKMIYELDGKKQEREVFFNEPGKGLTQILYKALGKDHLPTLHSIEEDTDLVRIENPKNLAKPFYFRVLKKEKSAENYGANLLYELGKKYTKTYDPTNKSGKGLSRIYKIQLNDSQQKLSTLLDFIRKVKDKYIDHQATLINISGTESHQYEFDSYLKGVIDNYDIVVENLSREIELFKVYYSESDSLSDFYDFLHKKEK